jgi:sugar-phosphatase
VRGAGQARPVRAALFDLDGTLVDSEVHTDTAIRVIAERHGVAGLALPATETRGRTWGHIAGEMRARAGIDADSAALAGELLEYWTEIAADVTPVPGAPAALREAAAHLALGVVSSSPRAVIDAFLGRLGIADCVAEGARIGGDAVRASKPDPDGFLKGAAALGITPADCLVFEDSSMFIMCCAADIPGNTARATAACLDYRHLPPGFWVDIAAGRLEIDGRVFA